MKKGDLVFVYKIFVGNLSTDDIQKYMSVIVDRIKISHKHDGVLEYFVPTHNESEHPVEVIDTGNLNDTVFDLLGELLNEVAYKVKKEVKYESKVN